MVVGSKKQNTLLAIKRVTLQRKTRAKLEFAAPEEVRGGFTCSHSSAFLARVWGAFVCLCILLVVLRTVSGRFLCRHLWDNLPDEGDGLVRSTVAMKVAATTQLVAMMELVSARSLQVLPAPIA